MRRGMSRCLGIGTAAAIALGSAAEAAARPFSGSAAGTTLSTEIDSDGDGTKGSAFSLEGRSNLGRVAVTGYAEVSPTATPATCANGQAGEHRDLTAATAVIRLLGDLIYWRGTGRACIVPSAGKSFIFAEGDVTGGTGKFRNAGGSIQFASTADVLVSDPQGRAFGGAETQFRGMLTR
jgi:hypothetical protein